MKKVVFSILALMLMAPLFGCAMAAGSPVSGAFYQDVHGAVWIQDSNPNLGSKKGEACATSYLGIIGVGDASIATAAANGGIKSVTHRDVHVTNLLGLVAKHCMIAYGN